MSPDELLAFVARSTSEEIASTASLWQEGGETNLALELLETAVNSGSVHPGLWHTLGVVKSGLDDFRGAIDAYTTAISQGFDSYVNRGFCHEQLEEWDTARADYLTAIEVDPKDVDALVNLGTMEVSRGRVASGTLRLKAAAALDPRANWQLADGYLAKGQTQKAEDALLIAIAAGERRAYLDLARLEIDSAPRTTVESHFEAAIEAGAHLARRELSIFLDNVGDTDAALRVALAGVAMGDCDCYAPAAVIFESKGDRESAIKFYALAVANGEDVYEEDLERLQQGDH